MRTTVTLEPDAEALLRKVMRERGITFKEAINQAVVAGLAPPARPPFRTRTYDMGKPLVDVDKALQLFDELEIEHQREVMRQTESDR
jgi:hypothetical protein